MLDYDVDARVELLVSKLREADYRITPQRLALLRLLAESANHPTAAQLYEQLKLDYPTTSLATVYKTLSVLKDMDEVLEIRLGSTESRFDGRDAQPHPHVLCVQCQRIFDLEACACTDLRQQAAEASGYVILRQRIDFYGICPECQNHEAG